MSQSWDIRRNDGGLGPPILRPVNSAGTYFTGGPDVEYDQCHQYVALVRWPLRYVTILTVYETMYKNAWKISLNVTCRK